MTSHDRYAHLRVNLDTFRDRTRQRDVALWCTECEVHLADVDGLCPLCRPGGSAAGESAA